MNKTMQFLTTAVISLVAIFCLTAETQSNFVSCF